MDANPGLRVLSNHMTASPRPEAICLSGQQERFISRPLIQGLHDIAARSRTRSVLASCQVRGVRRERMMGLEPRPSAWQLPAGRLRVLRPRLEGRRLRFGPSNCVIRGSRVDPRHSVRRRGGERLWGLPDLGEVADDRRRAAVYEVLDWGDRSWFRAWTMTSCPSSSSICAANRPRPSAEPVMKTRATDRPPFLDQRLRERSPGVAWDPVFAEWL